MAKSREAYYSLREEIDAAKEYKAVAAQLEEVIAGMSEAAWDTEIQEGEALYAADEDADRDDDAAGGYMKILSTELDRLCRSIRTVGKSRFKLTDPVLAGQFQDVPSTAYSVEDVISRAKKLDAQWGRVPNAETWEPIPGLTRTVFRPKITALETAFATAQDKQKAAQPVAAAAREKATHLHQLRVAFRTEGLASFPRGSAKWQLFNRLSPTTARRKPKAAAGAGAGEGGAAAPPTGT